MEKEILSFVYFGWNIFFKTHFPQQVNIYEANKNYYRANIKVLLSKVCLNLF